MTSDKGFVLIEALFLLIVSIILVHLILSFCMFYMRYEAQIENAFRNKETELIYEK